MPQFLDNKSKFVFIPQTAPLANYGHYALSVWPHDLTKGEDIARGGGGGEGLAAISEPPTNFYDVHIKNTSFSTLSY